MGMFDTVRFCYRMPDGETESEYQTKDLECVSTFYEISANGRQQRWPDDADQLADTRFDGCITVGSNQCYHLYFEQGQLVWIEVCSQDNRRYPFEPARCMHDED